MTKEKLGLNYLHRQNNPSKLFHQELMWNGLKRAEHFLTIWHADNPSSEYHASWELKCWSVQTLDGPCNVTHRWRKHNLPNLLKNCQDLFFCVTFSMLLKMKTNKRCWLNNTFSLRKASSAHLELTSLCAKKPFIWVKV